jgi:hypothetical protein
VRWDAHADETGGPPWRIYWSPTEPWEPQAAEPISEKTTLLLARRFWGRKWRSEPHHEPVKLDWEDVLYLNGVSDGGDDQTHADAEALIDALFVYGVISLELRRDMPTS